MITRYCPDCASEVEDAGGYCLLGHRLALDPPTASLEDLRAEVDRSFEEARAKVTAVLTGVAPPPPPPPAVDVDEGPQRPNPWKSLEEEVDVSDDPIAAFAPAPRMDWGPERSGKLKRRSERRPLRPTEA